jgi:hypothetical protein
MDVFMDFVGSFRFEFDAEMRAWWKERLSAETPNEAALAQAIEEVEREASGAWIEITSDAHLTSGSGDRAFYTTPLRLESGMVCIDKPTGVRVILSKLDADTVSADEPGKPPMRFRRSTK